MKQHQINYEILHSTYGDYNEDLIELFQEFVDSHTSILSTLDACFTSGNIDEYKKCLHHNASPFTYVGFPDVTESFRFLVKQCNQAHSISDVGAGHFSIIKSVKEVANLLSAEIKKLHIKSNTETNYMIAC